MTPLANALFAAAVALSPAQDAPTAAEKLFRELREAATRGDPEIRMRAVDVLTGLERAAALGLAGGTAAILFNRRAFSGSFREAVDALAEDARIEIVLTEEVQRSAEAAAPVEIEACANTSLASSLDHLCEGRRLRWAARDGRVTIEFRPTTPGDAVTCVVYDIAEMVAKREDHPGYLPTLGRFADIGGSGVSCPSSEPQEPALSSDDLVTLISEEVDPDVWADQERHSIALTANQNLLIKAPVSTQEKVAAYLQRLRELCAIHSVAQVWVLALQPAEAANTPDTFTPEEWTSFRDRMTKARPEAILAAARFSGYSGQRVSSASFASRPLVIDWAPDGQPVMRSVVEGTSFDVRAIAEGESTMVEMRIGVSQLLGIEKLRTAKGEIELPQAAQAIVQTTQKVKNGQPTVILRNAGFGGKNTLLVVGVWERLVR